MMKKITSVLLLTITCFFIGYTTIAQTISLVTQSIGPSDENIKSITTDSDGNIFYSGAFSDTATISGIVVPPYFDLTPPSFVYTYLARHDNSGGANWAIPIGGPGLVFVDVDDMKADADGNLICIVKAAIMSDTLHIGNFLSIPASGTPSTSVMIKIDAQGNLLWSKIFTGIFNGLRIAADSQGDFYLCGWHTNSFVIDTVTINPSNGSQGNFIAKANADGNFLWGKSFSSNTAMLQFLNLTINEQDELFMSGGWEGDTLFIDHLYAVNPLPGGGNVDRYIAKFDSEGNVVWLQREGSADSQWHADLEATSDGGVMSLSNVVDGTSVDINDGTTTVQGPVSLFTRYNSQGNLSWHQTIMSGDDVSPRSLVGDGTNYYVVYNFLGPQITLGGTTITNMGGSNGTHDLVIAKLDSSANIVSTTHIGSNEADFATFLMYTANHELLIGGTTKGSELQLGSDIVSNAGFLTSEVFIAKISSPNAIERPPIMNVSVYPNPANNLLNIKLDLIKNGNIQVNVLNVLGQNVMSQSFNGTNEKLSLQVDALKPAVYLLNIMDGNTRYSGMFVKE